MHRTAISEFLTYGEYAADSLSRLVQKSLRNIGLFTSCVNRGRKAPERTNKKDKKNRNSRKDRDFCFSCSSCSSCFSCFSCLLR